MKNKTCSYIAYSKSSQIHVFLQLGIFRELVIRRNSLFENYLIVPTIHGIINYYKEIPKK